MPADSSRSNSFGRNGSKKKGSMKLQADAKEFVPSAATLKATAAAWRPGSSKEQCPISSEAAGSPPKNGANTGSSSVPPDLESKAKQAPKANVAAKGAWGKKPSDAIRKAAPSRPQQSTMQKQQQGQRGVNPSSDSNGGWRRSEKSGKKHDHSSNAATGNSGSWARAAAKPGGNKGVVNRQSRGGGGAGSHAHSDQSTVDEQSWQRGKALPVELLNPGDGKIEAEKAVKRIRAEELLEMRLGYVAPPLSWTGKESERPPSAVIWDSATRLSEITAGEQSWQRGKSLTVELLNPGDGSTEAEKTVKRIRAADLLEMRMNYVALPLLWKGKESDRPPSAVIWDSPTRIVDIEVATKAPRMTGDATSSSKGPRRGERTKHSKNNSQNDTAPPLEQCKPIEVNEETRWKAKVFEGKTSTKEDTKEEILRKALLILNKLSLTKFDKLSDKFINCGIGRDIDCLTGAVGLIVNKAQEEPHFSSMYAGLCLKLANTPMEGIDDGTKKGKKFKKILLERCQIEFETDTSTKIKEATEGITDEEEIEYHSNLIKKHYLGHMRFIGELYKGDLISIKIMIFCLPKLLRGDEPTSSRESEGNSGTVSNEVDEEKIECFAKLMTVIGSSLEKQSEAMRNVGKTDAAENLADCWRTVEIMAGRRKEEGPQVSRRIKFMLQDLLEMRDKGWVTRRKEETAKTIAQIHNEVAKEERAAARRSSSSNALRGHGKTNLRRGASSGDVRALDRAHSKPQADADGFVAVASSKGVGRSSSMTTLHRSQSDGGWQKYSTRGSTVVTKTESVRRTSSGKFAALNESEPRKSSDVYAGNGKINMVPENSPAKDEPKPKVEYPSPDACGDKVKNILKEYFVGGDTDDAILSIHELVGVGHDGSNERGTEVVSSAVLMVLEMKQEDVDKFLSVFLRCAKEGKIQKESFASGLNDPLEFLSDIIIDAPLAAPHLIHIIAELINSDIILFEFLLDAPEYFKDNTKVATFGAKVLKKIGADAINLKENIEVVEKLMTDEDKASHRLAKDFIAAV